LWWVQEQLFTQILEQHDVQQKIPPVTLSIVLLSLSHTMGVESTWGLTKGHKETLALIAQLIETYDLPRNPLPA